MTDAWVVTLHDGGGSTVEAANPIIAIGPMLEAEARAMDKIIGDWVSHHPDRNVREEWWPQCFPLTAPRALPVVDSPTPLAPGQQMVDVVKFLNDHYNEEYC